LEAGTYDCFITCPASQTNAHQARLRNTSDGTTQVLGSNAYAFTGNAVASHAIIQGRFSIASQKTFEIQHRGNNTVGTDGFGKANSFGENEIYTVAEFWKVD
jgi:hypothetical protein